MNNEVHIEVKNLYMAYGDLVIMNDLSFQVSRGEIFVVMGGSGCGKSTLLKYMIGLKEVRNGSISYSGVDFASANLNEQNEIRKKFGVLFQGGALWSSMTLAENVAIPLEQYTDLNEKEIADIVGLKLSLVGLRGFEEFYPSEISGGMRKRAGLARAMALDPEILFFDEPSAGLDPINSRHLDELMLELRDSLGATFVVVTHELSSIFAIADNAIYFDAKERCASAIGNPHELLRTTDDPTLREFLTRGEDARAS